MAYCRFSYEFSMLDEFKPGESKVIDFYRSHPITSLNVCSQFLHALRWTNILYYDEPDDMDFDGEYITGMTADKAKEINEHDYYYLRDLIDNNQKEMFQINETLKDRRFIRTDNYLLSHFIAYILKGDLFDHDFESKTSVPHYVERDCKRCVLPDWMSYICDIDGMYERIKPMDNESMKKILEVLESELTPSQYGIMKYYISHPFLHNGGYEFASTEMELLSTAFYNIRNHKIFTESINEIMDNTLF